MLVALSIFLITVGSIAFHFWSPWWWTEVASNWGNMDDTILLADFKRGAFKIAIDNNLPIIPLVFYDLKLKHPWYPKFGSLGKLRVKVLDKISVNGLKEKDIPMLTKKAFDTIKVELQNDPKKAAVRATEKWKKILA